MNGASRNTLTSPSETAPVPEPPPNPELLTSLGRLVRGLSALFWGLPIALVVCVQTANGEWLTSLGVVPPLLITGLLFYGLAQLGHFQPQERVWRAALERARIFALVNVGLAPFLFWWNQLPFNPFYRAMVGLSMTSGLCFLFALNPVLRRLSAMLPDETLRSETKLFTSVNRYLLLGNFGLLAGWLLAAKLEAVVPELRHFYAYLSQGSFWLLLLLVLVPIAMTMALIWKTKEVILSSIFGPE